MAFVNFFAYSVPSHVGHGGQHRAYQIQYDLEQVFGIGKVHLHTHQTYIKRIYEQASVPRQAVKLLAAILIRLGRWADNPKELLFSTAYTKRLMYGLWIAKNYEKELRQGHIPALCVIEHSKFFPILQVNKKYGVPTFIAPQNLDSLNARTSLSGRLQREVLLTDFANELQVLQAADERLFISRVETGVIGGLGLPSVYYPYTPLGEVAANLDKIRQARQTGRQEPGLFLILGTFYNRASMEGATWFLDNAQQHGLPDQFHVVFIGQRSSHFRDKAQSLINVEILDYVEQQVLDDYLQKAQGVLILNKTGFGAVTRLAEMRRAGLPAITFSHPTYAVGNWPGLTVAGSWSEWLTAMSKIESSQAQIIDGETCEQDVTSALIETARRYAAVRA